MIHAATGGDEDIHAVIFAGVAGHGKTPSGLVTIADMLRSLT